jgi:hypothetical protein
MRVIKYLTLLLALISVVGCATHKPYDYTEYKRSDPKSILILPPKNSSPDVKAPYSYYSHTQRPISEAGYYVFPIAVVDETFKNNGLTVIDDMHQVAPNKLHEIFGADAALYINIKQYGTQYYVIKSASVVAAEGKLVDLKNGKVLWEGKSTASSEEGKSNDGGLVGMLVGAIVDQIFDSVFEKSHQVAGVSANRLLQPTMPNGILYGHRSSLYKSR